MLLSLIQHTAKRLIRNFRIEGNSIISTLIKVFSIAYLCMGAWLFGGHYKEIMLPGGLPADQISVFYRYFIYFVFFDAFFRYHFQNHFFISLQYYRHLPINRNRLIFFNVTASPFNITNVVLLLFIVPFCMSTLHPVLGGFDTLIIFIFLFLYIHIISYLVLLLRSLTHLISYMAVLPWLLLLVLPVLKSVFHFEPAVVSTKMFVQVLQHPIITLGAVLLTCIVLLAITVLFVFKSQYYDTRSSFPYNTPEVSLPDKIRSITLDSYLRLEMHMIFRNKRPLTLLIAAFGLALMLIIPFTPDSGDIPFSFMTGVLMTGITGFILGQYAFSTESEFFDFIHSRNYKLEHLIKSKHKWYSLFCLVTTTIIILISGTGTFQIYLLVSAALFNVGIGFYIQLYAATFNLESIELQEFPLFSHKSVSLAQIIALIIILVLPYFIFLLMNPMIGNIPCLIMMNMISLYSLYYHTWWKEKILKQLFKRKYIHLEGFRK